MAKNLGWIITFVFVIIVYIIYDRLVKSRNRAHEARLDIELLMKERWDAFLVLAEIIKECPIYKDANLDKVIIELTTKDYGLLKMLQKFDIDKNITKVTNKIFEMDENAPELKQNSDYKEIKEHLIKVDKSIEKSKKDYNALSKEYNKKIEIVPNNIVAILFGFNAEEFLKTGK